MSKTPVTQKTSLLLANQWSQLINDFEFATLIWPPRSEPIRRVIEFVRDEEIQKKVGLKTDKTIFAILDFKDEPTVPKGELYADILWELSRELREKGRLVEEFDSLTLLKHLEREGYRVVLFVFGIDRMLQQGNNSLAKEIALVYKRFENIAVLCFLRLFLDDVVKKTLMEEAVFSNTNLFYHPVYSPEDSDQFISYIEEQWDLKISPKLRKFILDNFSGKLGSIKNALRIVRLNPDIDPKLLLNEESVIERGKLTLMSLHEDVLPVVKKIQSNNYDESSLDKNIVDYLKNIGIITNEAGIVRLYPKYLNYINLGPGGDKRKTENMFDLKKLTNLLTFHELRVFELLQHSEGEIVSRDQIAERMWESDVDERYSDWAIDQMMYRLRQRLTQAKIPLTIKTKRGQGFVMLDSR